MLRKRSGLPTPCAVREPAGSGLTARLPSIVVPAPVRIPDGNVDSRLEPGIGARRMKGQDAAVFGRTVPVDTRGQSCLNLGELSLAPRCVPAIVAVGQSTRRQRGSG